MEKREKDIPITHLNLRIKPKMNYEMLGTDIRLDHTKKYWAVHAINQPDWKKKGKIFVLLTGRHSGDSFLLEKGEYVKLKKVV